MAAEYLEASRGSSSAGSWTGSGGTTAPALAEETRYSDSVSSESAYTTAAGLGSLTAGTSPSGDTAYCTDSLAGTGSSGSPPSSGKITTSQASVSAGQGDITNFDGWVDDPSFKGWSWNDLAYLLIVLLPLLGAMMADAIAYILGHITWGSVLGLSYGSLYLRNALAWLDGRLTAAMAFLWQQADKLEKLWTALERLYAKVAKCWPWVLPYLKAVMDKIRALIVAMTKLWNMLRLLFDVLKEISLQLWMHSDAFRAWERAK
ncbi:MAG: hypothetical protein V1792_04845 [Pseudomonadota bacterium]